MERKSPVSIVVELILPIFHIDIWQIPPLRLRSKCTKIHTDHGSKRDMGIAFIIKQQSFMNRQGLKLQLNDGDRDILRNLSTKIKKRFSKALHSVHLNLGGTRIRFQNRYVLQIGKACLPKKRLNLNSLYMQRRCTPTPPRQSATDPKPVCHFDPLLIQIKVSYRAFG